MPRKNKKKSHHFRSDRRIVNSAISRTEADDSSQHLLELARVAEALARKARKLAAQKKIEEYTQGREDLVQQFHAARHHFQWKQAYNTLAKLEKYDPSFSILGMRAEVEQNIRLWLDQVISFSLGEDGQTVLVTVRHGLDYTQVEVGYHRFDAPVSVSDKPAALVPESSTGGKSIFGFIPPQWPMLYGVSVKIMGDGLIPITRVRMLTKDEVLILPQREAVAV
jgi:hypothetical protein